MESFREINQSYEELYLILELEDPELFRKPKTDCGYQEKLAHFETELLLSDEYDNLPAIVDIHPGAGGTNPGLGFDASKDVSKICRKKKVVV